MYASVFLFFETDSVCERCDRDRGGGGFEIAGRKTDEACIVARSYITRIQGWSVPGGAGEATDDSYFTVTGCEENACSEGRAKLCATAQL